MGGSDVTLGKTMTDLSTLLKNADPVEQDEMLPLEDALRMRREMLAALAEREVAPPLGGRSLTFAATAAMVMTAITVGGHRSRSSQPFDNPSAAPAPAADGGSSGAMTTRQLQFATPGGTRIIWIFDENLRLQESLP